jgi:colanic acid/amylovoran biosynthesis glycosyltransferase
MAAVKPDLLHAHFGYVAWGYLAAAHAQGIPLVATFYGVDACMLPRRGAWRRRYAALFEYGAAFIAEGPFLAKTLEALGCPAGKIRCIPIGVDIEALRQAPDRADEGNLRVLFTGLSREKKGPFDAAAAFAAAAAGRPGLRLDLIGDGPFRKPVENRLREAGILDRCTFHGTVTAARYREILKRAAIALAPSVIAANGDAEGGAPVTVIEAQAAGIPVIGTRHCDIPHVVAHGETGLLYAERDAAGLAAGLKRLAGDPDLRTRMGASAAARAAERHDIRKQVEKITAVYAEAAPKKCFSRGS